MEQVCGDGLKGESGKPAEATNSCAARSAFEDHREILARWAGLPPSSLGWTDSCETVGILLGKKRPGPLLVMQPTASGAVGRG